MSFLKIDKTNEKIMRERKILSRRVVELDIYRCLFVLLAAFSHVAGHLDAWDTMSKDYVLIFRIITRGATPGLIILFGVMVELVYVRRVEKAGLKAAHEKLMYRCVLCYVAFVAIALAGVVGGNVSLMRLIGAISLTGTALYANIFKIYLFILLATLPLLAVRVRRGFGALVVVVAIIWLLDYWFLSKTSNPFEDAAPPWAYLRHSLDFFVGLGESWGPSILHSVSLVIFGMLLANSILSRSNEAITYCLLLVAISLALTAMEIMQIGYLGYASSVADITVYRMNNSPLYYAYGVLYSIVMLGVAWLAYRIFPRLITKFLSYIGSRTFSYFMCVNMLIVLTPGSWAVSSISLAIVATIAYSLFVVIILMFWDRMLRETAFFRSVERGARSAASGLSGVIYTRNSAIPNNER